MESLTYIASGAHLSQSDIETLQKKIEIGPQPDQLFIEAIIYVSTGSALRSVGLVSVVSSGVRKFSSLEKAIATASGDKIIFTTAQNIIADNEMLMLQNACNEKDFLLAVPMTANKLLVKLGVRRVSRATHIIAAKGFASVNATLFGKPMQAVMRADKVLGLRALPSNTAHLPDAMIANHFFLRPNFVILKHAIQVKWQQMKDWAKKRREMRLTKRVLPAKFSDSIPVFIICRDRVDPLKKLVYWCEKEGLKNIYLIDNASTYPPLLEYFNQTKYEVIRLRSNIGHTSPWSAGIVDIYAKNKTYIVSDPDVLPDNKAHGAVKHFVKLLNKYPIRRKVGFGLRIDNLPDHYALKSHVIAWEKQFWVSKVEEDVFDAEIDTTFALYRPGTPYVLGPGLRTGGNYVAEHEPWYLNSKKISKEVEYYRSHADKAVGSWGIDTKDVSETYINHSFKSSKEI